MIIRRARADEMMACAELYDRVARATFTWFPLTDLRAHFLTEAQVEEVWVAENAGRLLGLASLFRPDDFLHSLYVERGDQGRGVGLALLRHVDSVLPGPVSLKVQVLNFGARRFYAREGFRVLEEGGEAPPTRDRWLRVSRAASPEAPSPAPVIEIAPARADELPLCAEIYARIAMQSFPWEPPEARTPESKMESFENATVLVAREGRMICGFAAFDPGSRFLDSLFVEPQGQGVGEMLLGSVADVIGGPFTLHCVEPNVRGLAFYRRLGFTDEGRGVGQGPPWRALRSPPSLGASGDLA